MTIFNAVIQSFSRAGDYNRDDQIAPAVILWRKKERQDEGSQLGAAGRDVAEAAASGSD